MLLNVFTGTRNGNLGALRRSFDTVNFASVVSAGGQEDHNSFAL